MGDIDLGARPGYICMELVLHIRQISSEIMNGKFRGRGNFLKSVGFFLGKSSFTSSN